MRRPRNCARALGTCAFSRRRAPPCSSASGRLQFLTRAGVGRLGGASGVWRWRAWGSPLQLPIPAPQVGLGFALPGIPTRAPWKSFRWKRRRGPRPGGDVRRPSCLVFVLYMLLNTRVRAECGIRLVYQRDDGLSA